MAGKGLVTDQHDAALAELAVGASMGFMLRLAFEAGAMAGELISQGTGLAFAQMSDPLRGVNSGVVGQWFYLAFGLLFFTANGHLALVSLLLWSVQPELLAEGMQYVIVNGALAVSEGKLTGAMAGRGVRRTKR